MTDTKAALEMAEMVHHKAGMTEVANMIRALVEERNAAVAEHRALNETAWEDAQRWRYWRSWYRSILSPMALDAAIDAARAGQEEKP